MSSNLSVHFSSKKIEYPTPVETYDRILEELMIDKPLDLDVCATAENTKCKRFYDIEKDGLKQDWSRERIWMNPPYGREIAEWTKKAARKEADLIVALLPARTDTLWWHRDVIGRGLSVYFIKGRITFEGAEGPAPFPSAVVTWERKFYNFPTPLYGSFDAS